MQGLPPANRRDWLQRFNWKKQQAQNVLFLAVWKLRNDGASSWREENGKENAQNKMTRESIYKGCRAILEQKTASRGKTAQFVELCAESHWISNMAANDKMEVGILLLSEEAVYMLEKT